MFSFIPECGFPWLCFFMASPLSCRIGSKQGRHYIQPDSVISSFHRKPHEKHPERRRLWFQARRHFRLIRVPLQYQVDHRSKIVMIISLRPSVFLCCSNKASAFEFFVVRNISCSIFVKSEASRIRSHQNGLRHINRIIEASQLLLHFVVASTHVSGVHHCATFSQNMPFDGFHRAVTSIPTQEYGVSNAHRSKNCISAETHYHHRQCLRYFIVSRRSPANCGAELPFVKTSCRSI